MCGLTGNQQSRAARPGPGAHPWQGWLRPHGRLVHPRCKCAPCRFLDPRTGTRTTQVPATKSCLTSPGNPASAARTGLPAALHARYFRKSPIWAPKSPPARRLPPNVADQVHLTLNQPVRSGSNLTAEAGSNSKKGGVSADTIYETIPRLSSIRVQWALPGKQEWNKHGAIS